MTDNTLKPADNPMKFFEGSRGLQASEAPKTKEEAAQRTVEAYREDLAKIADPQQRGKAEAALRAYAQETFGATDKYVDKIKASQERWQKTLNSLGEKNPIRIAGEHAYSALQRRNRGKLGGMILSEGQKPANIIASAQKASAAYKQRQHSQRQPEKDNDRER
jgi:hypothetical protein